MALGGGLAVSDRRYALAARKQAELEQAKKKARGSSGVGCSLSAG